MKEGWESVCIGDIADVYNGNSIPAKEKKERFIGLDSGIPYIGTKDVTIDHRVDYDNGVLIPEGSGGNFKLAPPGSVLVCAEGGSAGRKVAHNDKAIHFGNKLYAIVPGDNASSRYLFYYCIGASFRESFEGLKHGLIGGVSQKKFRAIAIPFPPLAEQERIVAILDEAFGAIATAIGNTERVIFNARELFQSERHYALARATEHWETRPLGEVCENLDRLRVPITKSKRVAGDVPYYGASGVVDHVADHLFDEDLLLVSEDGANLLARTYPIAFSISGKSWVNNHAHVLRLATDAQREFVERYLNSIPLDQWVSGMAQPKLNQRSLNAIPIPWTEDDKPMRVLTDGLREVGARSKRLTALAERKLSLLKSLKEAILSRAFSGELTAVERELSDASV